MTDRPPKFLIVAPDGTIRPAKTKPDPAPGELVYRLMPPRRP